MNMRRLTAPHELERPGDFCFFESVQEKTHPGGLWFYVWLPNGPTSTAVRIHRGPMVEEYPQTVRAWDGDPNEPTLAGAIKTDHWTGNIIQGRLLES